MRLIKLLSTIALSLIIVLGACAAPASPPPSPTPAPTPTVPPFEMPRGPGATWQLVIISDSSLWRVGEALADRIEKDTGAKVEYIDYAIGSLTAGNVLEALQTGKSSRLSLEKLPAVLKDAEMVIVFLNPWDSLDAEHPLDMDQCFEYRIPGNCDPESMKQWTSDLNGIWREILKLRAGQPTILRAVDLYNPLVQPWKENGVFEDCTECWENMSDAVRQAAEPYNIPFVSRLDMMNGINHDEDPRLKGFILEDGEHPSELGAQYMAELIAGMGYDPVIPTEELKIVFSGGTCNYSGPSKFPYGQLRYSWRIDENEPTQYGLITFSLAEGKTLGDFQDWEKTGETQPPEWVITLAVDDMHAAGGSSKFSKDLTTNGKYKGDPVYIACYRSNKTGNINILGPFSFTAKPE
jgi:hypothetical protein